MKAQRFSMTKIGLAVAAPLFAAFFSIVVSSIAVIATKKSPIDAFSSMLEYGFRTGSLMEIVNIATPVSQATAVDYVFETYQYDANGTPIGNKVRFTYRYQQ